MGDNPSYEGRFTPHEEKRKTLAPESLLDPDGLLEGSTESGARPAARVTILFFAAARQAAGIGKETVEAATLADALEGARGRHGDAFAAVLEGCRVWVNGEPAEATTPLRDGDEVAVLPPVSGGAG